MLNAMAHGDELLDLLRLTLTPGLGSVLIERVIEKAGSAHHALRMTPADLERVQGVGASKAASIAKGMADSLPLAEKELEQAARMGVAIFARSDAAYPPLLSRIPSPPPLIYIKGTIDAEKADRFPVAIVGSRECSAYGVEQSERFGGVLGRAGLTIVSGGARGVDTAAHRGALAAGGRTIAVVGCGLAMCYPPENAALFERIAQQGAVVSELPLNTPPSASNFPARNRIISGLSLGVIVIEAGLRSGALITARVAAEDHNREVMALPGRVDAPSSAGTLALIKSGGAMMVTEPKDVLELLESPARHEHRGTHEARYAPPGLWSAAAALRELEHSEATAPAPMADLPLPPRPPTAPSMSDLGGRILDALAQPRSLDELCVLLEVEASRLRTEVTMLEVQRRVTRDGSRLKRR